jgi:hypothetical protein
LAALIAAGALAWAYGGMAVGGGGLLEGAVTTEGGGCPIGGALVVPVSVDRPARPVPEIASYTNAKGQYEWRLHPGRYRITVRTPDYNTLSKTVVIRQGLRSTLNFELKNAGSRCRR